MVSSAQLSTDAIPPRRTEPRSAPKGAWFKWTAVIGTVAAVAIAGYRLSRARTQPLVRYQTSGIDRGPITAKVTASGTVSAIVMVQVGSQVSGRIDHLYVDYNSPVKSGQLIATIEPSFFRAAVALARANRAAASAAIEKADATRTLSEKTYVREQALFAKSLVAAADVDSAKAQAESSRADVDSARAVLLETQAALDQAELNLSYTRIVSPIGGVVISRTVDVGQTVAASFQAPTLFTIAEDLTKMQVDTNIAEGDVGRLHEGMDATFTVDAFPDRVFRGKIRQIRDNAATLQNVVTYDAVIDVDNADEALRPAMTANSSFVYASRQDAVRIPTSALRFKPDAATIASMTRGGSVPALTGSFDERLVWVFSRGDVTARVVRIGLGDGIVTEVVSGDVHPGEVVVTEASMVDAARRGS